MLRQLRVAFTAPELETLQTDERFARALGACGGSAEETRQLIALGGALLAERTRAQSKLRRDPDS